MRNLIWIGLILGAFYLGIRVERRNLRKPGVWIRLQGEQSGMKVVEIRNTGFMAQSNLTIRFAFRPE